MAGQKTISTTYTPPPEPPPLASYHVHGNDNPAVDGDYFYLEDHNGKPAYVQPTRNSYLWWSSTFDIWVLSFTIDSQLPGSYYLSDPSPIGAYSNSGTFSGNPIVDAGPG